MNPLRRLLLAALLLGVPLLTVAPPPAQAALLCTTHVRTATGYVNVGGLLTNTSMDEWWTRATVSYDTCWNTTGTSYVQIASVTVGYNREGASQSCSWLGGGQAFKSATFNAYYWQPQNGVNFNPPAKALPCAADTTAQATQTYTDVTLPVVNGVYPRFKVVFHADTQAGLAEPTITMSGTLRPCTGLGDEPCDS